MKLRVSPGNSAGTAQIEISGLAPGISAVKFRIWRRHREQSYLGPAGSWQASAVDLTPLSIDRRENGLVLNVGPQVVDPVGSHGLPVKIEVFDPGSGEKLGESAAAFEGVLLSAARGAGEPLELPPAPEVIPSAPQPAPPSPPPPSAAPAEAAKRSSRLPMVAGAAALALIGIGAAWWLVPGGKNASPPEPPAATLPLPNSPTPASSAASGVSVPPSSASSIREQVAAFLNGKPSATQAASRALEFGSAGQLDGAFLVYRYAAELGHPGSAVAIGRMYDPRTHSAQTSPFPRPNRDLAIQWYELAARNGSGEGADLQRSLKGQ